MRNLEQFEEEIDFLKIASEERTPIRKGKSNNLKTPVEKSIDKIEAKLRAGSLTEQNILQQMRRLSPKDRVAVRNHLQRRVTDYPHIKSFVDEWPSLEVISQRKQTKKKHNPQGRQRVWTLVEKSAPLMIGTEMWYVRILYHTVEDRLYLDARKWESVVHQTVTEYRPSGIGMNLPLTQWQTILPPLIKLLVKRSKH